MKVSSLILLPVVAEAAVLWPRQLGFGSSLRVASVKKLEPEVRPNAVHVIQRLGPITLKGVWHSLEDEIRVLTFD